MGDGLVTGFRAPPGEPGRGYSLEHLALMDEARDVAAELFPGVDPDSVFAESFSKEQAEAVAAELLARHSPLGRQTGR
jgi:hypothetical protein